SRKSAHYARWGNLADRVVVDVPNVQVACFVHGGWAGLVETSSAACTIRNALASQRASESRYDPRRSDFADGVVVILSYKNTALAIHGDTGRPKEERVGSGSVQPPGVSKRSCYGGYLVEAPSRASELTDTAIIVVRDINNP